MSPTNQLPPPAFTDPQYCDPLTTLHCTKPLIAPFSNLFCRHLQSRTCFCLSVGLLLQSIDPQPQLITNTDIARIFGTTEFRHLHVVGMYAPVRIRAEYCRMLRYDLDTLRQSRYSKGPTTYSSAYLANPYHWQFFIEAEYLHCF